MENADIEKLLVKDMTRMTSRQRYGKTTKELLSDYCMNRENDIIYATEVMGYFEAHYPETPKSTIEACLHCLSTNFRSRIHRSPRINGKDDVLFRIENGKYRLYNKNNDPPPIYKDTITEEEDNPSEYEEDEQSFAYEKDLQNFIVNNLQIIEPGLTLFEEEGIKGIEYPAGGRSIDILAVDKNNNYVIIELKVSKGYDRVIGQLLRYIGWVKQNLGQKVRGIIICKEISEDLILACSETRNVELFEYELSVQLNKIEIG